MKAKYNQSTHSLEEQPEMKEPVYKKYHHRIGSAEYSHYDENYNKQFDLYKEHIASLKKIDVGVPKEKVPDYWKKDGQTLDDKDFRVDVEYEDYEPDNRKTRIVAIPIEEEKAAGPFPSINFRDLYEEENKKVEEETFSYLQGHCVVDYDILFKQNEDLKKLLSIAGCPKVLIDNPSFLFGKPTDADIDWAKNQIDAYEALPQEVKDKYLVECKEKEDSGDEAAISEKIEDKIFSSNPHEIPEWKQIWNDGARKAMLIIKKHKHKINLSNVDEAAEKLYPESSKAIYEITKRQMANIERQAYKKGWYASQLKKQNEKNE